MAKRKHVSLKTRLASTLLALGHVSYDRAKTMSEDEMIRQYEWDHNMLHWSEHEHRDAWWNLTPMLVAAHRAKTRQDAKIIAKGRRLQAKLLPDPDPTLPKRKIQSHGFRKDIRRRMDGTVVKREGG